MKTQLLYVLVSSQADVYLEQAYVSATSARLHHPEARIVLLTDRPTADGLADRGALGKAFKALFSELVVADDIDPALPAMKRSRLLKTGMRGYIKGDFLYIDVDTLVARPLDDIDAVGAPLAACRDLHSPFARHPHRTATLHMCRKLGFDASGVQEYFNGGVMLVKDTPGNHRFFQAWRRNYLAGYAAGIKSDQPSLAQTIATEKIDVSLLKDEWNCEVQNGVRYLRDAYVVHYMVTNVGSGPQDALFLLNDKNALLAIRKSGKISPEVQSVIENPFLGYAPVTQVFAGDDLYLFQSRRYRWLRSHYKPGKWSLGEFLLKVRDHLLKKV